MGTGEKQWGCEFLTYDFSSKNKTNKKANKQSTLLTLTVSFEKRSCLIRSETKKTQQKKKKKKNENRKWK